MIKMRNICQNILKNKLDFWDEEVEIGESILISFDYFYMEFFEKALLQEELDELRYEYRKLDININKVQIEKNFYFNFLFINRGSYYSCFFNIEDYLPLTLKESNWKFTTNHDSSWSTDAFSIANEEIKKFKNVIMEINKAHKIDDIYVQKHIIPNSGDFNISKNFMFSEVETNEMTIGNNHKLLIDKNIKIKLIKE